MESRRMLTQLLVLMTCCLVTALARMATSMQDDDVDIPESLFSQNANIKRNNQEENAQGRSSNYTGRSDNNTAHIPDISKLLLKHLRFRQLPEPGSPMASSDFAPDSRQNGGQVEKRHEQRMLVNNLAALLSGLRDRQVESSMRMPSLRFGK